MVNYYDLLEVAPTATPAEIKAAYRRLALVYHPDRNADNKAAEKFASIKRAYEILSKPDTRSRYDLQANNRIPFTIDNEGPTVFITERIWMRISRRRVSVNEQFSVIIRSFKRSKEPILQGLDQFDVVNYYSQVMLIQDRPMREVLYVLRCKQKGIYSLGPAKIKQGRYEYISGSYDIEVIDAPIAHPLKPSVKAITILLAAFIIFLTANIVYYVIHQAEREKEEERLKQFINSGK